MVPLSSAHTGSRSCPLQSFVQDFVYGFAGKRNGGKNLHLKYLAITQEWTFNNEKMNKQINLYSILFQLN